MSLLQKSPIKRRYSAKETYNFREPTNHSHPISHMPEPSRPYILLSSRAAWSSNCFQCCILIRSVVSDTIGCDWKPPIAKRKRSPTTSHGGEGAAAGGGEDVVHDKDHDANPDKIKVYSFYLVSRETAEKLALMQGNREAQKGVEFGKEELGAGVSWLALFEELPLKYEFVTQTWVRHWLIHKWRDSCPYARTDSFINDWLIHKWRDSLKCDVPYVTQTRVLHWLIHKWYHSCTCDVTYSRVTWQRCLWCCRGNTITPHSQGHCADVFTHDTCGVATIRRLLKMIGLFCKRAL